MSKMSLARSAFSIFAVISIAVFLLIASSALCVASDNSFQIKGSDSEVNLVQKLAEIYMAKNKDVSIAVTGGGSGTGIAALINGQTDIANSSRQMKDEEIKKAQGKSVSPIGIIFAIDGLSIIVNESLNIESLSIEQLGKIFKGEIKNWKEVGGEDLPINLYGRQSNSGTYMFFRDFVVKADYAQSMKTMNGNAQIVESVKQDKSAVGYVGVGYVVNEKGEKLPGLKVIDVKKDAGSEAVSPLDSAKVNAGLYPLVRPLFQYVNGVPKGKMLDFILFELSQEGQDLIKKEGFYPINKSYEEQNKKLGITK